MTNEEFKKIQFKLGYNNRAMGDLLGKSERTIDYWRSGEQDVEINAAWRMRKLIE